MLIFIWIRLQSRQFLMFFAIQLSLFQEGREGWKWHLHKMELCITYKLVKLELSCVDCFCIQFLNINIIPLVKRKDVFFILTIFPKNFWNKLYLI